jgi:hypothetical protein
MTAGGLLKFIGKAAGAAALIAFLVVLLQLIGAPL